MLWLARLFEFALATVTLPIGIVMLGADEAIDVWWETRP